MKIDTSHINLSSTHTYLEKKEIEIEQELKFSNLIDNRLRQYQLDAGSGHKIIQEPGSWYELTTFGSHDAIELSRQFIQELEKLQQIFDSIIQALNQVGRGCCFHLTSLDLINVNSHRLSSIRMVEFEYTEYRRFSHYESQETHFNADGMVKTADGRQIDFNFEMNLAREFFHESSVEYRENGYYLIDPLIINFDASLPQLAETYFSFDLDVDGTQDLLPSLAPGSGLLSFDKNHDGIINDGSELFGPATGDGFGELSQYDQDQNFWIDENDEIFDELTIWENDENGEMHLTKIKDAGIGAIYLVDTETPFDIRDENNHLQARIKSSGIALNEDGGVSSIQEIDWNPIQQNPVA